MTAAGILPQVPAALTLHRSPGGARWGMDSNPSRIAFLLLAACLAPGFPGALAQEGGDLTIYRCTGTDGVVVIGNVPCGDGQDQQVRSMVRPVDAEPAPAPPAPPTAAQPPPAPVVRQIVARQPQPIYECVRPDGSRYESDTGFGEERWVPLWTGGGWPARGHRVGGPGRGNAGARGPTTRAGSGLSAPPSSGISIPRNPPQPEPAAGAGPRPRPPRGGIGGPVGGTVERDPCHILPPAETCARLRDRRDDIRSRFFNAQQRERDTLRTRERALNARIDADCGTY